MLKDYLNSISIEIDGKVLFNGMDIFAFFFTFAERHSEKQTHANKQ
jgi:hypothetical protein